MKRDQAGPILDKKTKAGQWVAYKSTAANAPKVCIAEPLLEAFPDGERPTLIEDIGHTVVRNWLDFPKSFSDESPKSEAEQKEIEIHSSFGTTATVWIVFHKGELWAASERII